MEAWNGYNLSTTNYTQWLWLLNLSTVEWRIGKFPPNVIAVNGSFNASRGANYINSSLGNDTGGSKIFILTYDDTAPRLNATQVQLIAYLLSPVLAALMIFAYMSLPLGPKHSQPSKDTLSSLESATDEPRFMPVSEFEEKLRLYYSSDKTEAEVQQKDFSEDPIEWSDVEGVAELLRQWYDVKSQIVSQRKSLEADAAEKRRQLEDRGKSLLEEIEARASEWERHIDGGQNRVHDISDKERRRERTEVLEVLRSIQEARGTNQGTKAF